MATLLGGKKPNQYPCKSNLAEAKVSITKTVRSGESKQLLRVVTSPSSESVTACQVCQSSHGKCNETVALGHKDQAKTGGRMPLWHLPIPLLRNGGTCTPSLWLPAHSIRAHTGYLS
eukprot:1160989-Pelagomonas_calceolata.AAC.2